MPDLELLLRDSIGEIAEIDVSSDVAQRVRQRRRRRRGCLAASGTCTAFAIVAVVAAIAGSKGPGSVDVVGGQDQGTDAPLFSTPTGAVLLIDDGYYGVSALDVDTGVVGRRAVNGQRPGAGPLLRRPG